MKKQILHIAAALSLFLTLGVSAAAQTSREMTVNIPFDFYVGKTELPAGTYTIYRTSATSGYGFILRSDDLKSAVMFNGRVIRTSEAGSGSRIEFRRLNDRYFLSRILGGGNGYELQTARIERASSDDIAQTKQADKPDIVSVSAR